MLLSLGRFLHFDAEFEIDVGYVGDLVGIFVFLICVESVFDSSVREALSLVFGSLVGNFLFSS